MASRSEATATVSSGSSTSNRIIDSRRLLGPFNFYIRKRLPPHERTMKKRGNACGQSLTCEGRGSKIPCSFDQRGYVDCRCCERDSSGVVFVRPNDIDALADSDVKRCNLFLPLIRTGQFGKCQFRRLSLIHISE